jgi:hypothetical protein
MRITVVILALKANPNVLRIQKPGKILDTPASQAAK